MVIVAWLQWVGRVEMTLEHSLSPEPRALIGKRGRNNAEDQYSNSFRKRANGARERAKANSEMVTLYNGVSAARTMRAATNYAVVCVWAIKSEPERTALKFRRDPVG